MSSPPLAPRREFALLAVLTLVGFSTIVDFVLVPPLAPQLMRAFALDAEQFAGLIGAFTLASFVVGVLGAPLLDRFDRRPTLLVLYGGFGAGSLLCALASSPGAFLCARLVAGAFAGIASAAANVVLGDAVPEERLGAATGFVNASYALAFVVGVPAGLWLASHSSWRLTFALQALVVLLGTVAGASIVPSMRGHLAPARARTRGALREMVSVLADRNHARALAVNALLMASAFAVTPFVTTYFVSNLGFPERSVPLFYLVGGLLTSVASVLAGQLADRRGSAFALAAATAVSLPPTVWVCVVETRSLAVALAATSAFMVLATARLVPATAMALETIDSARRGISMSLNAALQQIGCGVGAVAAGALVSTDPSGALAHFGRVGALSAALGLACIPLALGVRPLRAGAPARPPASQT